MGVTAVLEAKTCDCGTEVTLEIPDDMNPKWQKMLRELAIKCAACEAAEERERQQAEDAQRQQVAAREFQARVRRADIPRLYRRTWDELDDKGRKHALAAAHRWAAGDLPGLMLTGDVGVGKSTLAAAAAAEYLRQRELRWISVPALMGHLAADWNSDRRRAALDMLDGRTAVVLDDLDKSRPSAYAAEQLLVAIESRTTAGSPLLVTTNLSLDELAARFPEAFGPAIASRLAGYCEVYGMTGRDRRIKNLRAA